MQKEQSENAPHPFTKEEIIREEIRARVARIEREFTAAFAFIKRFPRSVTFFGSSRSTEDSEHYRKARMLSGKIVRELHYAVITGGSAGIMEAGNRGAFEAGGESVGIDIRLPSEQRSNRYTTDSLEFSYFFVRKVALSFAAEAYLFFPGGFGTLDEFFEIVTLVQTGKIRKVPIFLVGKDYWEPLQKFIQENVYALHRAIDKNDLNLYKITDDDDEIIAAIRNVPVREEGYRRRTLPKHV